MVFGETTGFYDRICRFNGQINENERAICEFETDFKKSFVNVLISE